MGLVKDLIIRPVLSDYWRTTAAIELNKVMGKPRPKVLVWHGDNVKLTDKIS